MPELIMKFVFVSSSLTMPYCPLKSPDLHTMFIAEHSVTNWNRFGAKISIFAEDEYKLQTASMVLFSLFKVVKLISIVTSSDWNVAQDVKILIK